LKKQPARTALPPDPLALPAIAPAEDLTRSILRHWKVAALIAAAVTLLAWLAAAVQPKTFRATSIAAVTPITAQMSTSDVIRGVDTLERRVIVSSLAALAAAPITHRQTRAGDGYTIVAAVMPNTNLFRIDVEGPDPRRAAAIANQVPSLLGLQAQAMYRFYGVSLVSEASAPRAAAAPRVGRAVAAGLVLGVLLGVAAAWLLERRRFS
jgi:capsular polysaccharide biosynthesis protein